MNLIQLFDFDVKTDHRGELVVIESNKTIPFEIKRIYYLYGTQNGFSRGYHAHKQLQQVIFPVMGQCRMIIDDGHSRESIVLNDPKQGLFISKMIWREMHDFSNDCVLLALASEYYDEADYIRDYSDFLKLV